MKIIKLNDNQIKCTLSRADLAKRHLKINELTYGSKKARDLFQDMMMKARQEVGFETDNIPIMIEAIPCEGDSIELLITKVEDPDELDVRFSKFAPEFDYDDSREYEDFSYEEEKDEELVQLFNDYSKAADSEKQQDIEENPDMTSSGSYDVSSSVVRFDSIEDLIRVAKLGRGLNLKTSLFVDKDNRYYLFINGGKTERTFARAFYAIKEYGKAERSTKYGYDYLKEHCRLLIKDDAISTLSEM